MHPPRTRGFLSRLAGNRALELHHSAGDLVTHRHLPLMMMNRLRSGRARSRVVMVSGMVSRVSVRGGRLSGGGGTCERVLGTLGRGCLRRLAVAETVH